MVQAEEEKTMVADCDYSCTTRQVRMVQAEEEKTMVADCDKHQGELTTECNPQTSSESR
jgi:hypothetical protein